MEEEQAMELREMSAAGMQTRKWKLRIAVDKVWGAKELMSGPYGFMPSAVKMAEEIMRRGVWAGNILIPPRFIVEIELIEVTEGEKDGGEESV